MSEAAATSTHLPQNRTARVIIRTIARRFGKTEAKRIVARDAWAQSYSFTARDPLTGLVIGVGDDVDLLVYRMVCSAWDSLKDAASKWRPSAHVSNQGPARFEVRLEQTEQLHLPNLDAYVPTLMLSASDFRHAFAMITGANETAVREALAKALADIKALGVA